MFFRSAAKFAVSRGLPRTAEKVPNCIVSFGHEFRLHFVNHPGVMAVTKLLELRALVEKRANFTQGNIDEMKNFDEELAAKAQIAYDNGVAINMKELLDIEANLPKLLEEKAQLENARSVAHSLPEGQYNYPPGLDISKCKGVPDHQAKEYLH